MPQLAIAAAGAAIGGAIGGTFLGMSAASVGWMAGSMLGSMLFAPEVKSEGPKLTDLKAAAVSYGTTIPYVEGHPRLGGVIVWASDKREIASTSEQGGKGGGGATVTSYTYEQDLMFLLSENVTTGLRRVWMNGDLVWSRASDGNAASVEADSEKWSRITFYSGDAAQMPDPTYEAAVGVGNAPAYRGRSSVFIEALQLGNSGQLPIITFEVNAGAPADSQDTAQLIWEIPLTEDLIYGDPPDGAYAANFTRVALPTTERKTRIFVKEDSSSQDFANPVGAYSSKPAQGNSDDPGVGYGPAAGTPAFYFVSAALSVGVILPDVTDYMQSSAIRYSKYGNRIAVGNSLANGTGSGTWYQCVGAKGAIYIIGTDNTNVATIAHGSPVSSLALTTGSLYALSGSTLTAYSASGWASTGTIDLPAGSGHRIFTNAQGGLMCANSDAEVYSYASGWTLEETMTVSDEVIGTATATHWNDDGETYAAAVKYTTGSTPDMRWRCVVYSGFQPEFFFDSLDEAIMQYGQYYLTTPPMQNAFNQPRAARNLTYTINRISTINTYVNPYTLVTEANVTLEWWRYYGYPGDSDPPGYYRTTTNTYFYRFQYQTVPTLAAAINVYRAGAPQTVGLYEPTLQDVVERQCERAGLSLSYVDASDLSTRVVRSMVVSQISSPRQIIDMLAQAYMFTSVESEIIRFRWRGGSPVETIAYDDLAASEAGDAEPLPVTRASDLELPVQVFVSYANVYDDYQDGTESSDRMISSGKATSVVQFPIGFTPTEARRIADAQVMDAAASVLRVGPFSLTRDYAHLEPSDVVLIEDSAANTLRVRIGKKSEAGGILSFEGVSDDANITTSVVSTSTGGYRNSTTIALPVATDPEYLDIPILTDEDDGAGFYVVVKPAAPADVYPGAVLFKSSDGTTYAQSITATNTGTFGTASTILADGPVGVVDEISSVTVNLGAGATLSSITREQLLGSTANTMLIGSELIRFQNASLITDGVYTLTGLLRGRRGTEWAVAGHIADERVVLLDSTSTYRVPMNNSEIGVEKSWKAVTGGRSLAGATAETFSDTAVGLKPFAPVDVRVSRDSSGNATIAWQRRSRLSCRLIGAAGISVPLGEESESWDVEIYATSGYATVSRTISSTSATASYTAAQQTTDFGSAQSTLYMKVYQRSAAVGRGYAATAQG